MDTEIGESGALFRAIYSLLVEQTKKGEKLATENQLAEKFETSRYKVRLVLDQLTQMGVLERTQKKGMELLTLSPEKFAERQCRQIIIADLDKNEVLEARKLSASKCIPLCLRRISPVILGKLDEKIRQMSASIDFHSAVVRFHFMFHKALLSAVGNRLLFGTDYGLLLYIGDQIDSKRHFDHEVIVNLIEADRTLLNAIRNENLKEAEEAIEDVYRAERELLLESN